MNETVIKKILLSGRESFFLWFKVSEIGLAILFELVPCYLLSVTSHINGSVARCLINVVYLAACAFISS